jgi:A/G-specific adenine glycosylase
MGETELFSKHLLHWYGINKRSMPWRESRDPYHIWLSEVMLQQTQVATVIPYYLRFLKQYPTLNDLADARDEDVLKLWEGLGYYRRCHNFMAAVRKACSDHQGHVPDNPDEFLKLPGVGPYTTAAVMSIAYGHQLPVVDGNVIRVVTRYDCIEGEPGKTAVRQRIHRRMEELMPDHEPGDFNQSVMELGAMVCTPRQPQCVECPLHEGCCAVKNDRVSEFPHSPQKTKAPEYAVALGLIVRDTRFLVQKRPSEGHLAGMWEFPGGKAQEGESLEAALERKCLEELGLHVDVKKSLKTLVHAYSHFKIRLTVFLCGIGDQKPLSLKGQPLMWIYAKQLADYPFPAANHKCFDAIQHVLS